LELYQQNKRNRQLILLELIIRRTLSQRKTLKNVSIAARVSRSVPTRPSILPELPMN
jgi:hypothetical protein